MERPLIPCSCPSRSLSAALDAAATLGLGERTGIMGAKKVIGVMIGYNPFGCR